MTWRDIPRLAALEPELFGADAWSEPTWWTELAHRPKRSYVVAEEAGRIAGYAGIDRSGQTADLMTIAVAPDAQGRGWGGALMRYLVADARDGGADYLMLEVRADNAPAQRLYERAGFVRLRVRRRYYRPGDVDACIMRLDLNEHS